MQVFDCALVGGTDAATNVGGPGPFGLRALGQRVLVREELSSLRLPWLLDHLSFYHLIC